MFFPCMHRIQGVAAITTRFAFEHLPSGHVQREMGAMGRCKEYCWTEKLAVGLLFSKPRLATRKGAECLSGFRSTQ